MNWRVVFSIARKDLADAVKNLYILFALLLPLGMAMLFRMMLDEPGEERTLKVAVLEAATSRLTVSLETLPQVEIIQVDSEQQLEAQVGKQIVGGLVIPAGFDAAVDSGEQPELKVYLNQRYGGGGLTAFRQLIQEQVWRMVNQEVPARISYTSVSGPFGASLGADFNFEHYLLVMFLVLGLAMTGAFVVPLLLVEEKEKHTLEALLVSPGGSVDVVVGKALTGLVYSLFIAVLLLTLSKGWVGDWPFTLLLVFLAALLLVGLGLFMGGLFQNTHQVNTWASIVMLALILPSWAGFIELPQAMELPFKVIPTYYVIRPLSLALGGNVTLAAVGMDLAILAGCILLTYAAVVWTLKRQAR